MSEVFHFKKFEVAQSGAAMKVGTDSVLLGCWTAVADARRMLDIGAGTGVLALMMAQKAGNAPFFIDAVEIDADSAALAEQNFARSPWAGSLRLHQVRIQEFAKFSLEKYDLIISNPPFFSGGTFAEGQNRAAARQNFQLPNGDLLQAVRQLLGENGRFCLILPWLEGIRFAEMASVYGLHCTRRADVFGREGRPEERVLLQLEKNPYPFEREEIIVYGDGQAHSAEFRALTADFYVK